MIEITMTSIIVPLEGINAEIVANEKGPVAGVAQAAMPSVVAITSVSMQEIRSFFGYGMNIPAQEAVLVLLSERMMMNFSLLPTIM